MTQFLPPNLLALFAPRDPIVYLPPLDKLPHEKKLSGFTGVGTYLQFFEDPKDTPPTRVETREERHERKRRDKQEQVAYKLEQEIALWEPLSNVSATSDPYKTLFVARINYDTTESKLRREFEVFGPIRKIVVVHDRKSGKPRGYAFIEYEHERDMHSAYKHADGKKIDGRRVLVDVERSRTVKGWLPRRLGGGIGGTRRGGPDVNVKHSGREELIPGSRRSRSRSPVVRDTREVREPREREARKPRERRRRSRSRSREERPERHRERKRRSRDRSRSRDERGGDDGDGIEIEDRKEDVFKERKRSRSRERKRRRSRSRSRDRSERKRRDRGDRRGGDREKDYLEKLPPGLIKQEPVDNDYSNGTQGGGGVFHHDNSNHEEYEYDEYNDSNEQESGNQYNSYYSSKVTVKAEPPD